MITINIKYTSSRYDVREFEKEMIQLGIVNLIRKEEGNICYEYFYQEETNTLLLIDSWTNQEALDKHHKSKVMEDIIKLRDKYDLHMEVHKYVEIIDDLDNQYIRK